MSYVWRDKKKKNQVNEAQVECPKAPRPTIASRFHLHCFASICAIDDLSYHTGPRRSTSKEQCLYSLGLLSLTAAISALRLY